MRFSSKLGAAALLSLLWTTTAARSARVELMGYLSIAC